MCFLITMSLSKNKSGVARVASSSSQCEEESLETWFRKMGYNPEDPRRMSEILDLIESNPTMKYYFYRLKKCARPAAEVKKIRRIYLYRILRDGRFGFDMSKHFAVRCKADMDRSVEFEKSEWRSKALQFIKIRDETKKLQEQRIQLESLEIEYNKILSKVLPISGRVFNLRQLKPLLSDIKESWLSTVDVYSVLIGKRKGSASLQRYLKKSFAGIAFEKRNRYLQIPITMGGLNKLLIEFESIETELKMMNPDNFLKSITHGDPKKKSDKISLKTFLSCYFDKNSWIMDLLAESIRCLDCFQDNVDSLDYEISKALSNLHCGTVEVIKKVKSSERSQPEKEVKEANYKDLKTFMGEEKYSLAESILRRWGTSLESPDLMSVLADKRHELEFYRSIKLTERPEDEVEDVFSQSWLTSDSDLKEMIQENIEFCQKLKKNEEDMKQFELKLIEVIQKISLINTDDETVSEMMNKIKLTMIEFERSRNLDI